MAAPAMVPRLVIARPGGSPVAVNVSGCLPAVASAPMPSDTFAPARLAWLPGLILACFGIFWLVGPMTIAVLPLTALAYGVLFHRQWHHVFQPLGLRVRKNWSALIAFLFLYQILMSLASVRGYMQELLGVRRRWK